MKDQVIVPDMITELKHYGMHRHFTDGVQRADVRRRDEEGLPLRQDRRRAAVQDDRGASRRSKTCTRRSTAPSGISPKLSYEMEKRPFYVTRDGVGRAAGGAVREDDLDQQFVILFLLIICTEKKPTRLGGGAVVVSVVDRLACAARLAESSRLKLMSLLSGPSWWISTAMTFVPADEQRGVERSR